MGFLRNSLARSIQKAACRAITSSSSEPSRSSAPSSSPTTRALTCSTSARCWPSWGVNIAALVRYYFRAEKKNILNLISPLLGFLICGSHLDASQHPGLAPRRHLDGHRHRLRCRENPRLPSRPRQFRHPRRRLARRWDFRFAPLSAAGCECVPDGVRKTAP